MFVGGQGFGEGMMVKDLTRPDAKWVVMEPSQDYSNSVVDVIGDDVYILTSADAQRNRLVKAPLSNPVRANWQTVVPEQEGVLTGVSRSGNDLILTYERMHPSIRLYIRSTAAKSATSNFPLTARSASPLRPSPTKYSTISHRSSIRRASMRSTRPQAKAVCSPSRKSRISIPPTM